MSKKISEYTNFVINNTFVANYLHNEPHKCELKDSPVLHPEGGNNPTKIKIRLFDDVNAMEFAVMDAVTSFYANQIYAFSVRDLIRYMSGSDDKNITAAQVKKMKTMLEHLSQTKLSMRIEEQIKNRKLKPSEIQNIHWLVQKDDCQIMKAPLLSFETLESRKCVIHEPPILYEYACKVCRQLVSIPPAFLKRIDGHSDTDRLFLIRYYLLRRLEYLRYRQQLGKATRNAHVIFYNSSIRHKGQDRGLMKHLMLRETKDPKRQQLEVHKCVKGILNYYKALQYIEDYEEIEDFQGNKVGIEILGSVRKAY